MDKAELIKWIETYDVSKYPFGIYQDFCSKWEQSSN